MRTQLIPLMLVAFLLLVGLAFAFPTQLNVQGILTRQNGTLSAGTYQFNASIYDAPTGGTRVYQYNTSLTTTTRGAYDLTLKSINLTFSGPYYLGLSIGQNNLYEAEMTPRMNLSVVPYAYRANSSDDLNTANSYVVSGINATGSASFVNLHASGNVSALYFSGNGSQLTSVSVVDAWVNTSGDVMSGGLVGKDANFTNINASGTLFGIGNLIINNLFNVTAGTGVVRTAGTYYINGSEVCTSANGQCVAASCAATGRCGNLTYQNWNNTNAATAQINLTLNTTSFHVSGGNRRVGIGTKNPAVALDITADTRNGTAVVLANGGDQGVFYGAYDAIGTINSLMGIDGGDTFRMFGVVRMIFTVNGSEAMTIEDGKVGFFTDNGVTSNFALNGNISLNNSLYTAVVGSRTGVGIGTPSPVALLHVNGSMVAGDANFTNLNASSAFTLKGNLDINDLFNVTASSGRTLAEGELSIGSTLNTSTQNTTLTSQPGSVIFILGP